MRQKQTWGAAKWILGLAIAGCSFSVHAQDQPKVQGFVHEQSGENDYIWPTDSLVLKKLDAWQDLKFGVLFHWGLYSVPGIVESWSICSEDVDWISRDTTKTYDEYKKWYWGLKDVFNPTDFNPEQWADVMEDAGMKYMVFTTKHHDGFCMFDSKETDFSIAHGAFKDNPKRDVARYVFDAFRAKNFMIGAYFSKPDWHCPYYWWPHFATANRNVNYKIANHPERWKKYQEFTYNQIGELMHDYGHFDILWLDGGWVGGKSQDIKMDEIVDMAREAQPGLITVDRSMRNKHENYQTPERGIPEKQLNYPWESCITLSNDWGWTPNAPYKSSTKVIDLLAETTAKGGCLLLGVGPTPKGIIEQPAVDILHQVGEWLRANGQAIYNTETTPYYQEGNVWFTADKDGKTLYAIYALPDKETLPETIEWTVNIPKGKMTILANGKRAKYEVEGDKVKVTLPKGLKNEPVALKFVKK